MLDVWGEMDSCPETNSKDSAQSRQFLKGKGLGENLTKS